MKKILAITFTVMSFSLSVSGQGTVDNITIGTLSSYQGRIFDSIGDPLCGTHDLTFKVFEDRDGLFHVWEESQPVDFNCDGIHDGMFNVALHIPLDSLAPWHLSLGGKMAAAMELERWLEVTVGTGAGAQTILPRTRLLTSPFSYASARMIGDIYTSPSHIAFFPPPTDVSDCAYVPVPLDLGVSSIASQIALRSPIPPFSDCAYVPLKISTDAAVASIRLGAPQYPNDCAAYNPMDMAVNSIASQIALRSPIPPYSDCAYVPLNLSVTDAIASIRLGAPQLPNDCAAYDPIQLSASNAVAKITLRPPVSDCTYVPLQLSTNSSESKISMVPPDPLMGGTLEMSTGDAGGLGSSLKLGIISPGPPQLELYGGTSSSGPSLVMRQLGPSSRQIDGSMEFHMVQIHPDPLPQEDDMVSIIATPGSGSSLVMLNPQPLPPSPAEPWLSLSTDMTTGASLEMNDGVINPGPPNKTFRVTGGFEGSGSELDMYGTVNPGPPSLQFKGGNANEGASLVMRHSNALGSTDDIVMTAGSNGGKVGINTAAPAEALDVVGNICVSGNVGVCSDERYKKNIETITNALALIEKIRGVNFKWRTSEFPDKKFSDEEQVGFIAQELKEHIPELVSQGSDGFYSVDYSRLTPILVEAVKEQQRTIGTLTKRLERLEKLVYSASEKKVEVASK